MRDYRRLDWLLVGYGLLCLAWAGAGATCLACCAFGSCPLGLDWTHAASMLAVGALAAGIAWQALDIRRLRRLLVTLVGEQDVTIIGVGHNGRPRRRRRLRDR